MGNDDSAKSLRFLKNLVVCRIQHANIPVINPEKCPAIHEDGRRKSTNTHGPQRSRPNRLPATITGRSDLPCIT